MPTGGRRYKKLVKMAWRDGVLDAAEKKDLDEARVTDGISDAEHTLVLEEVLAELKLQPGTELVAE